MVNSPPIFSTISTETWIETTWENFLIFADDPTLPKGKFYYHQGWMRIEMSPLGSAHGHDNTILLILINLYAALQNIPIKGFTNTTFRKIGMREAQPDLAFYIGNDLKLPPDHNSPVNLDEFDPPTLVVEVAATSLEDDTTRKQKLYQEMGVQEYWVVNVDAGKVIAFYFPNQTETQLIEESQVLPKLTIQLVESALNRAKIEDDGAVSRWLLSQFQH
jgi:Uma2 family endonuclease